MIILPQCNGLHTATIWWIMFHQQVFTNNFLKLLNVPKACSDLNKASALSWQLYLFLLFLIQWLSHDLINFSRFSCERHRRKESSILNTRKFRFMFDIMTDLKVRGECKKLVIAKTKSKWNSSIYTQNLVLWRFLTDIE